MAPAGKIEIIPGTEVVFKRQFQGESTSRVDLVLIPRPSKNPDDPLLWSPKWKTIVIFNQFVFVFVSILTPLAIAPMTLIFQEEFKKSLSEVNMLFGAAAITLGYANFLIVPAANAFGRRPIILTCGLICVIANIWQGLVTSYGSFIAARVISGIGAAANESIMPMVISDVLFLHQRGRSMALYFWAYFLGIFIGPIIAGSIASHVSWRWFFWVCTILQALSWIFMLVAHPETKYNRPTTNLSPPASVINVNATEKTASDAGSDSEAQIPVTNVTSGQNALTRGKPSKGQFSVIPHMGFNHGIGSVIRDVISPIQILFYPIVLWASFAMGFASNSLLACNMTQAQVFGHSPYVFSPKQIGLVNFAFFAGAAIALVTAGPLADWIALRRARGNRGVLEAEFRLPALIPYVCINIIGLVVVAVGYQRNWAWEIIVIVGYTLVGIQCVGIPAIVISYAVDSYKALPGEIMIAATIVKNTFGFGMIFFFNDWAERDGFIAPMLLLMVLTAGSSIIGLAVFIPFGKSFRRITKDSKLHAM